jgi:hypothetical protein
MIILNKPMKIDKFLSKKNKGNIEGLQNFESIVSTYFL